MDPGVAAFLGVIVGGVITGVVTIGLEWLRGRQAAELDSAKRRDDRRIGLDNFQRETLLGLQDATDALARATSQIHHHDTMAFKATGLWRSTFVPEDVATAHLQASRTVRVLLSRVGDENVRSLAETLIQTAWNVGAATDQPTADRANEATEQIAGTLVDAAGVLIRATFVND